MMVNSPDGSLHPHHPWQPLIPEQLTWVPPTPPQVQHPIVNVNEQPFVPQVQIPVPQPPSSIPQIIPPQESWIPLPATQLGHQPATTVAATPEPFIFQQTTTTTAPISSLAFGTNANLVSSDQIAQIGALSNVFAFGMNNRVSPTAKELHDLQGVPASQSPESLTFLPPIKRTSMDIDCEDEQLQNLQPPSKQILSESKLLKKFGSLNLEKELKSRGSLSNSLSCDDSGSSSSGSDEDDELLDLINTRSHSTNPNDQTQDNSVNRYVYLLFRDKVKSINKSQTGMPALPANAFDIIARQEQEKLDKAVVLWSPSLVHKLTQPIIEEVDDEEYEADGANSTPKDWHSDSCIEITEITDDNDSASMNNNDEMIIENF